MKKREASRSRSPTKANRDAKRESVELPEAWSHASKKYKLSKLIGTGSSGQIVKGKCRETGQYVAIKYLKCDMTNEIML